MRDKMRDKVREKPFSKKIPKTSQRPHTSRYNKADLQRKKRLVARPVQKQELTVRRETNLCAIKDRCQSCRYINESYSEGLANKYQLGLAWLRETLEKGSPQIIPPEAASKKLEYRCLIKLALRKKPKNDLGDRFEIGLFQPESHQVVEILDCPLHHANLKKLIYDTKHLLEESDLEPFDETTKSGDLLYIVARSSHITGEMMIIFVVRDFKLKSKLRPIVNQLKSVGNKIVSAYMNLQSANVNVILGPSYEKISGANYLRERLCDFDFQIAPGTFFQINPSTAKHVYRRIEQLAGSPSADENPVAWDLFCGIGQISMLLARLGYRVLGIEENPLSIEQARFNGVNNKLGERLTFVEGRVENSFAKIPSWAEVPDVITFNPSRKGLAVECFEFLKSFLLGNQKVKIIYVSCAMESLSRDLVHLAELNFKLRQVEAFDMFPHTEKLEWIAVLTP